jgi:NitT/TauT family transport system substrate-binding protein
MSDRCKSWTRRKFLRGLTLAGTVSPLGMRAADAAAEPPPETTTIKFDKRPSICIAPQYIAEDLLRAEGFANVEYLNLGGGAAALYKALSTGKIDMSVHFAGPLILRIDAGDPMVVVAGAHVGCFELFATEAVRSIRDLKGRTVAVPELGGSQHVFLASMVAHVGLDPRRDIRWITRPSAEAIELLAEKKIDAYLGFPPDPQELRARKIGHAVVNSNIDRPWSTYFCCMVVGNREFVRKYPVATKRAVRAILKSANVCAVDPERVASFLVDKGYTKRQDYALQALRDIPYNRWRDYDPEDTMRFYSLRLHEAGMIKANPQRIIAQGTDWRFLNELKRELKG